MYLTVQCTASCRACGHDSTPVNAAVAGVSCQGCGADLKLPAALWEAALTSVAHAAAELPENGRLHDTHRHQGATLRVAAIRAPLACPHCAAAWSSLPTSGRWSCPRCKIDIPIRAAPAEVDGVLALIAEDRGLLGGGTAESVEQTLRCRSCGAPLDAGSERRVTCGSCDAQTVVPDEVYRRINAPALAASWFVAITDGVQAHPLAGVTVSHLSCGRDGVLYIVGSTPQLDFALIAVDTESRNILWMLDLGEDWPHPAVLDDGRVALASPMENAVRFASRDGITPGFSVEPLITDLCAHDGKLVLCTHPLSGLERRTLDGKAVPLWPPVGWLARLLGGGDGGPQATEAPNRRPRAMLPGRLGVGQDGDLRMVWGHHLVRYSSAGAPLVSVTLPGISIHPPAAAPDGTMFAVVAVGVRCQLVRVGSDRKLTTVLEADHLMGCACDPRGRVWTYGGDHEDGVGGHHALQCYDSDGSSVWRGPVT